MKSSVTEDLPPVAVGEAPAAVQPSRLGGIQALPLVRFGGISALLLTPCFWQSRIQAGDLSSHVYNAWLSVLIEQAKTDGLAVVPQWTNILFDLILAGLFRTAGMQAAERVAVSLSVLVFFWGAFALVSVVSQRRPWFLVPCLAMLTYGWVFHMGMMNFYLAMGLSFWAAAILWRGSPVSLLRALPLLILAYLAHPLPVVWAVGVVGYAWLARRIPPGYWLVLAMALLWSLMGLRMFLTTHFLCRWSIHQAAGMTGADQVWVFGMKYYWVSFGLLVFWGLLFMRLVHANGASRSALGIPLQICLFTACAVLLLPTSVLLPGYSHSLVYIAERMSLPLAVMLCALFGVADPKPAEKMVLGVTAGLFFAFIYADTRALNRIEDLVEAAVAQLPPGQRVVSALCDDDTSRINLLAHIVDRPCVGKCYSYANYEPSTGQFRVRAWRDNPIVASDYHDSGAFQLGTYVVKELDLPLYQIYLRENRIRARLLETGEVTGCTCFHVTPAVKNTLSPAQSAPN